MVDDRGTNVGCSLINMQILCEWHKMWSVLFHGRIHSTSEPSDRNPNRSVTDYRLTSVKVIRELSLFVHGETENVGIT